MKNIIIAFLFAFTISVSSYMNWLYPLDNILADSIYQHEQSLDGKIIVLGIDSRALSELGKFETWNRDIMANLISKLNSNPDALPAVIGVDIMFFGNTHEKYDSQLAEVAGRYGNVVVGSNINFKDGILVNEDGSFTVDDLSIGSYEEPYEQLKDATYEGFLNTMPDGDGIIRSSTLSHTLPNGREVNSFSYELYKLYAEKNGLSTTILPPVNKKNQWYIPFSSGPGGYSDNYSVVDVLNGDLTPDFFEDAIVLIGPYASGMRDAYLTAIDHTVPMHGVEIHANILQALIDGNFKVHVSSFYQSLGVFLIVFFAYFAFKNLRPRFSTPLMVILILGYLGLAYVLAQNGYLLNIIYLPLGLGFLYFLWLAIGYTFEILKRKHITNTFKKYLSPTVVDELIKTGQEVKLGGTRRDIACMFVDIRGFTPLSEMLTPEEVVDLLNEYLDLACKSIFAHSGTLDKFIGDAAMAIFNAPVSVDDYAYRSVLSAWDIVNGSKELNKFYEEKYKRVVNFGIGLNLGPAVVGNIGNDVRMDYTAIGDTVNTAARLESQAKPGQIILSESLYEAVKDKVTASYLGEVLLKGKAGSVKIYSLSHINEYENQAPLEQNN